MADDKHPNDTIDAMMIDLKTDIHISPIAERA
jgi:hypothetical protein